MLSCGVKCPLQCCRVKGCYLNGFFNGPNLKLRFQFQDQFFPHGMWPPPLAWSGLTCCRLGAGIFCSSQLFMNCLFKALCLWTCFYWQWQSFPGYSITLICFLKDHLEWYDKPSDSQGYLQPRSCGSSFSICMRPYKGLEKILSIFGMNGFEPFSYDLLTSTGQSLMPCWCGFHQLLQCVLCQEWGGCDEPKQINIRIDTKL